MPHGSFGILYDQERPIFSSLLCCLKYTCAVFTKYDPRVLPTVISVCPVYEVGDIGPLSAARGSIPPVCKYTDYQKVLFYASHINLIS